LVRVSGYLLDTYMASHIIKGDQAESLDRLVATPMSEIVISAVTEAELLFGVARRGHPSALAQQVQAFLIRAEVLDWDRQAAQAYGDLGRLRGARRLAGAV